MASPFQRWYQDTASALAYTSCRTRQSDGRAESQPPYNDVAEFLIRQHGRMPDLLRRAMLAATLGFDLAGLIGGTRWHLGEADARLRQWASWKAGKLGFQRDFIRYYESLATLGLFTRPSGDGSGGGAPGLRAQDSSAVPGTGDQPHTSNSDAIASRIVSQPARDLRCQVAVIGSGPGGAITAALLAEAGRKVILIEEGPFRALESCEPFSVEEMEQKYRNGGQTVGLGKNKIAYVEGRCVGGGSEINSGLYHRTPPEVLKLWRKEFGVAALSDAELQPHFEACEKDLSVSLMPVPAPTASLKLHDGATRLGWKSLEVPRWFRYQDGTGGGARQSMSKTFVPRCLKAGGRLLPRTRVAKIYRESGKWILSARHELTGPVRIEAETLFVCAGAVQTPALLRRSGITRNIGNSLRMHPTVKMVARFPETVNAAGMGVPVHQVKEFAPRLSFGCSISSRPYLALGLLDHPAALSGVSESWPHLANYYAMITGEGRGTVRVLPGCRDPLVRYNITSNDRRDLADGFRKLSEILFASGAEAIYPGLAHAPVLLGRDDLSKLPAVLSNGTASLMTIHLFSSCPMGQDKDKCAVDSFGRVQGFQSLFIADASLLCTAPGVNPQGSIMAIARRNALHYLGQ